MSSEKNGKVMDNTTISHRAGLTLPVRRVEALAKSQYPGPQKIRQGKYCSIVLTGEVEAVAKKIIEESTKRVLADKHSRITASYIDQAIVQTPELYSCFGDIGIKDSGIHSSIPEYNLKTNKRVLQEKQREARRQKKLLQEQADDDDDDDDDDEDEEEEESSVSSEEGEKEEPVQKNNKGNKADLKKTTAGSKRKSAPTSKKVSKKGK